MIATFNKLMTGDIWMDVGVSWNGRTRGCAKKKKKKTQPTTWYRSPLDHTLTGRLDQNTSHEALKQLIAKSSWTWTTGWEQCRNRWRLPFSIAWNKIKCIGHVRWHIARWADIKKGYAQIGELDGYKEKGFDGTKCQHALRKTRIERRTAKPAEVRSTVRR